MNAPNVRTSEIKVAAINAVKLLGVASNPAFDKICYLHRNDQPGVFGDWSRATGFGMFPVKGSLLRFGDLDRHNDIAELLRLIPRLDGGYWQYRGGSCRDGCDYGIRRA